MRTGRTRQFRIMLSDEITQERKNLATALVRAGYEVFTGTQPHVPEHVDVKIGLNHSDNQAAYSEIQHSASEDQQTQIILLGDQIDSEFLKTRGSIENIWCVRAPTQDELLNLIAKACIVSEIQASNLALESAIGSAIPLPRFPFKSDVMKSLWSDLEHAARTDATTLLLGETGVGKTTCARKIHDLSDRKDGPFITVSCAAMPRELMESELFGHERGAFTGATSSRPGCVELADKGTLFLDEIGDLPLELQPKLLTFIQEKWCRRLGGRNVVYPDIRIIAATNRDLGELVKQGLFRADLLYRLEVLSITVPPLRERKEDIPLIVDHYLSQLRQRRQGREVVLSSDAINLLKQYEWPGNVRELQNIIERAVAFTDANIVGVSDLNMPKPAAQPSPSLSIRLGGRKLSDIERDAIVETLELTHGDKKKAAGMLGISLRGLYNKIAQLKDDK